MTSVPGLRPPIQAAVQGDGAMQPNQQKLSGPVSEDPFGSILSNGEQNEINRKHQDITDSEKKVLQSLFDSFTTNLPEKTSLPQCLCPELIDPPKQPVVSSVQLSCFLSFSVYNPHKHGPCP